MKDRIIAWDLGTGGNKASLYDALGNCLGAVTMAYDTTYPNMGWHEQKPGDWWRVVVDSTRELLRKTNVDPASIAACGISGTSLGVVPLDASGKLLLESVPIWSDHRAVKQADEFFARFDQEKWYYTTGNGIARENYSIFKLIWYRENMPEMFAQIDKFVGTKDYINFKLTGKVKTDPSYADGCGAFDLKKNDYSDEIIAAAGLPRYIFPDIIPSTGVVGEITPEAAEETGLCAGTPVTCGGTDNSTMAMGAMSHEPGSAYMSLGSCFWLSVTDVKPILSFESRPYVFPHLVPGVFTSALCITSGGTSFRWVKDQLCRDLTMIAESTGENVMDLMNDEAREVKPGSNGVVFNPALAGGMPYDKSTAMRGAYMGLDLGSKRADMIRASMEGIAFAIRLCMEKLEQAGAKLDSIIAVGGAARSSLWCQILADCMRKTIVKTSVDDQAAALGAAVAAGVGVGVWKDFDIVKSRHIEQARYTPDEETAAVYDEYYKIFLESCDQQSDIGDMLAAIN